MPGDIEAFVLAGGKASRMGGRNKALLLVAGETLAARTIALVKGRMPVTVISDRAADFPFGVRVIPDLRPGLGPLGGIETGLAATDRPCALFLACDLPYLTWAVVAPLVRGCEGYDVTLYRHARYEPLVAVYSAACLPHVRTLLAEGKSRPIDLLPRVRTRVLPIADERPFRNLNRLSDLAGI
jgi:molybdopterin-guanine dinucleotide biosynthesis protein A